MSKKFIILIFFASFLFFMAGYFLIKIYPDFKNPYVHINNNEPVEVTLEFWGLWDNSDDWEDIIEKYEKKEFEINGKKIKISVNYTKKDYNSYEKEISKSIEKNRGPNIFIINNNWLRRYVDLIEPLENNSAYEKAYDLMSYDEVQKAFPVEVIASLIYQGKLYAMPLYSDSLALYYNKDLFEEEEINSPPQTWQEFKKYVRRLTIMNRKGEIVQSGAAFGGGNNVNRSADILALLIMQGGGKVIDQDGKIDINKEIEVNIVGGSEKRTPGKRAIEFYTEFSNPKKEVYSWDVRGENSLESFAHNKVAMMINYSYQIKNLLAINPDLNYAIAKMPQLENSTPINFSNVWVPVVSKTNDCRVLPNEMTNEIDCQKIAWSFLSFVVEKENSKKYINSTGKTATRKDLLQEQINSNNKISIFASQVKGSGTYNKFNDKIDEILTEMIDNINLDEKSLQEEMDKATEKIEKLKKQ